MPPAVAADVRRRTHGEPTMDRLVTSAATDPICFRLRGCASERHHLQSPDLPEGPKIFGDERLAGLDGGGGDPEVVLARRQATSAAGTGRRRLNAVFRLRARSFQEFPFLDRPASRLRRLRLLISALGLGGRQGCLGFLAAPFPLPPRPFPGRSSFLLQVVNGLAPARRCRRVYACARQARIETKLCPRPAVCILIMDSAIGLTAKKRREHKDRGLGEFSSPKCMHAAGEISVRP